MEIKNKIDWDLKFKNDCVNEIYALLNNTKWNIETLKEQLEILTIWYEKVDIINQNKETLIKNDDDKEIFQRVNKSKVETLAHIENRISYLFNMVDRINFIGIVENQEFNKDKDDFVALMEKYETNIKTIKNELEKSKLNEFYQKYMDNTLVEKTNYKVLVDEIIKGELIDNLDDLNNFKKNINYPLNEIYKSIETLLSIIKGYDSKDNYDYFDDIKDSILGGVNPFRYKMMSEKQKENNTWFINQEKTIGGIPFYPQMDKETLENQYLELYYSISGVNGEFNDYGFSHKERQALLNDLYKHYFIWKMETTKFDDSIDYMSNINSGDCVFSCGIGDLDTKEFKKVSLKDELILPFEIYKSILKNNPKLTLCELEKAFINEWLKESGLSKDELDEINESKQKH